ncbi:hypothetical protein OIU78_029199, partial [Salix suchowensis]
MPLTNENMAPEPKAATMLDWTSSLPRNLFMTQAIPALVPVITAKLRACIKGPPAKAC